MPKKLSDLLDLAIMDVKAIALDWNGTALNDMERAIAATNRVLEERLIEPLTTVGFRETFRLPMDAYFRGLGLEEELVGAAVADWSRYLLGGSIALGSGIADLLEAASAASIPVGVISAASYDVVRGDAARLGIADALSFITGGARPKSESLRELAERFGGRILYAGDTEYDIREAKSAGAIAVAFTGGYRRHEDLLDAEPDCVIDDFAAIARLLSVSHGICSVPLGDDSPQRV